jgi:isopenicillin N synthase-like dioxygenase
VCESPTTSKCRCGRTVCGACHKKDWAKHKSSCQPRVSPFPVFDIDAGGAELCAFVRKKGFAIVRVAGIIEAMRKCVDVARWFFLQPFEQKRWHGAGPGPGQKHGYMDLEATEVFEARMAYDPNFTWPGGAECRGAVERLRDMLHSVARRVVRVLCEGSGVDFDKVVAPMLENGKDLGLASNSALRILLYSKPVIGTPNHLFGTGDHTDNSFVTVAPASAVRGLELLPRDDEAHWLNVEEAMAPLGDVVCVFVGDSLSKLTDAHYPSVLHRPSEQACLSPFKALPADASDNDRRRLGRISTPFFLRARQDAVLGDVTVAQLETNHMRCRELWPWKQCAYYQRQTFHKE